MSDITQTDMAAYEVRASLTITGFDCDPGAVSEHLDLRPVLIARRPGKVRRAFLPANGGKDNEWVFAPALDLPEPRPARLGMAELLQPLRDALEPRRERLATLPNCARAIRIEILPHQATPDIALADGDLDFLARLGLPYAIDIRTAPMAEGDAPAAAAA